MTGGASARELARAMAYGLGATGGSAGPVATGVLAGGLGPVAGVSADGRTDTGRPAGRATAGALARGLGPVAGVSADGRAGGAVSLTGAGGLSPGSADDSGLPP